MSHEKNSRSTGAAQTYLFGYRQPFCTKKFPDGPPRSAGPAHLQPSPARTDTSSLLPCPLQCEQKNFPKQKQSVREQTAWGCFAPATGSPSARRMSWPRSAGVRPPEMHHPVWRQKCERGTSLTESPPHLSYDDVTLFVLVQVAQQGAGIVGAVEGPQVFSPRTPEA